MPLTYAFGCVVGFREFAQVLSADDVMQWAPSNKEKAMADLVKQGLC